MGENNDWRAKALETFAVGIASHTAEKLVDHLYKLVAGPTETTDDEKQPKAQAPKPDRVTRRFDFQAYVATKKSGA